MTTATTASAAVSAVVSIRLLHVKKRRSRQQHMPSWPLLSPTASQQQPQSHTHHAGCCGPAHGVGQALLDLPHALVAGRQHTLIPLGVEQLGARVKANSLTQRAHLCAGKEGKGGKSVRSVGVRRLLANARGHNVWCLLAGVRWAKANPSAGCAGRALELVTHSMHFGFALPHRSHNMQGSTSLVVI